MKEVLYKYSNRGIYLTEDDTSFGEDFQIKIVAEPHYFSLAISGDILRNTSFGVCTAVVSCDGEVVFYDNDNNIICHAEKGEGCYKKIDFKWKQESISILFGHIETVDYYPNCDGESDRWGTEWVTERTVTLNLEDNSIQVK